MDILLGFVAIIVLVVLSICYIIVFTFIEILKMSFGYRKYEYSKILSHGIKEVSEWHKSDEEALKHHKDFEFVSMVRPHNKRLRPIK